MHNSGENTAFQNQVQASLFMYIKFKLIAPSIPQHKGIIERAFATPLGRTIAMLNQAGLLGPVRHKLWAECARTSTMI
jgi:hypothetical protein